MKLIDFLDKNKKIVENQIKKFFISFFICTFWHTTILNIYI